MTPVVVALVDDLLFTSKIRNIVGGRNGTVTFVVSPDDVQPDANPILIVVDLEHRRFDPVPWVGRIRDVHPQVPVVAFCSHVKTSLAEAARKAGVETILTRGTLTRHLEDWLSQP